MNAEIEKHFNSILEETQELGKEITAMSSEEMGDSLQVVRDLELTINEAKKKLENA